MISLKTIRLVLVSSSASASFKCHAIASPSRSSSEASQTISAFSTAFFNSLTTFTLSSVMLYFGSKLFSKSMLISFAERSLICPNEDITTKSLPKNFSIVFALAGDSTITRFFAIYIFLKNGCKITTFNRIIN